MAGIKEVLFEVSDNDESKINPQTITKLLCSSKAKENYYLDNIFPPTFDAQNKKIVCFFFSSFASNISLTFNFFRNTILALGSFLDTFQKIADAAINTKGQ